MATKKGLRPSAIPDITARARNVFKLADGAPRTYEADGQTVRLGKDVLMTLIGPLPVNISFLKVCTVRSDSSDYGN